MAHVKFRRGTYKDWVRINPVLSDGEIVAVIDLPWYRSWFGLKPVRLKYGQGKPFNKTKFL